MSEVLFATCTPNSMPVAGYTEHGYQINVLDDSLTILCQIELPDWHQFRPASAGHRLIEHGYMIVRGAYGTESALGWKPVALGWMTRVIKLDTAEVQPARPAEATATPCPDPCTDPKHYGPAIGAPPARPAEATATPCPDPCTDPKHYGPAIGAPPAEPAVRTCLFMQTRQCPSVTDCPPCARFEKE